MTGSAGKRALSPRSIVVASKDLVATDLAGETVLLSMTTARYSGLAGVGAVIWAMMRDPVSVSAICQRIVREYDVPADRCEADVLQFLQELATEGLIEVGGDP